MPLCDQAGIGWSSLQPNHCSKVSHIAMATTATAAMKQSERCISSVWEISQVLKLEYGWLFWKSKTLYCKVLRYVCFFRKTPYRKSLNLFFCKVNFQSSHRGNIASLYLKIDLGLHTLGNITEGPGQKRFSGHPLLRNLGSDCEKPAQKLGKLATLQLLDP